MLSSKCLLFLTHNVDPERLKRSHVVITSYSTVASEHAAFVPEGKDKSKGKKTAHLGSDSDSADSDSGGDNFGGVLKATRSSGKKVALFGVNWWRIVLG